MEGHISHKYARFITSRPFAFSEDGLTNKIQLLNLFANNIDFDFNTYLKFKYNDTHSYYKSLKFDDFKSEFRLQSNNSTNPLDKYLIDYSVSTPNPYFDERFLKHIDKAIKYFYNWNK